MRVSLESVTEEPRSHTVKTRENYFALEKNGGGFDAGTLCRNRARLFAQETWRFRLVINNT